MTFNLPNILTLARVLILPALVMALMQVSVFHNWLAFGLYFVAAISDYLDGYFARTYGGSRLGAIFDPIADKMFVVAVLVMLVARGDVSGIHIVPVLLILLREFIISGLREALASQNITMPVMFLAKVKTTAQLLCMGFLMTGDLAAQSWWLTSWIPATLIGHVLLWIAGIATVITAISYIRKAMPIIKQMD